MKRTRKPRITIQTTDGPKRIGTQWASDTWAVHRTYLPQGRFTTKRCWTLTHRASGQAIVKHIEWREARVIVQQLEQVVERYNGLFTEGMCPCEQVGEILEAKTP